MFVFTIFLSYFIGCISTIAIIIYVYIRYGLDTPDTIVEQKQYQRFHPSSENDLAKNSTVDTVNYLVQFLFQEMKDTSKIRRYVMNKLHVEFNDLKKTKIGKLFLQEISIQSFSLGKECPVLSDIQLERQERDERLLIKEVVTKINLDYRDGFSVALDITLVFGYKCQLYIKVKRIQGHLRLEFRREPFSHWLAVFQDEPYIDFDIRAYLSSRESPQLAQIISQQIRRIIRRKQTWPAYKIRYQPFFTKSKQSLSTDILSPKGNNLIPGIFDITIKYCDRLSIPFEIFEPNEYSLLTIFLTININEQICEDYLQINRDQWRTKHMEFIPKLYKINIKEVVYMDRKEFLIDQFDPILNEIDDREAFKIALEDKNIFLLEIQGQQVKTLKQINRLMRDNDKIIEILVGMPLLHTIPMRHEKLELDQSTNSIQTNHSSTDQTNLIMIHDDFLPKLQAKATSSKKAASYAEFHQNFEFQVDPAQRFVNICLWCKPPHDCQAPNLNKKLLLLGYATIALSEIVLDAQMSFKRETQMTVNFQSDQTDSENKKLTELSIHKNYDQNLVHGFVTINIKHQPDIEIKFDQEEKRERLNSEEPVIIEHDDEQLTSINEEQEPPLLKPTDHIFEDQTFPTGTLCACCNKKIWMKSGRQCRSCSITVHKKCEEKFNHENICTHETVRPKSLISEDESSLLSTDDIDPLTTPRFSRKIDTTTTTRRSFRKSGNKNIRLPSNSSLPEFSRNDDSDNNSPSPTTKRLTSNQTSSKIVNAASSAYSRLRGFKTKRPATFDFTKTRSSSESATNEDISEADLQDIITRCLSDEMIDTKSLEDLFHEKAVDHTAVYAKANQFRAELFRDFTLEERKQKLDHEISRLQQEIDLQRRIRDETIIEYNNLNNLTDENAKRNIKDKIGNIDEKIQALAALTIFYCSGLRYCCSEMDTKLNSKTISDNSTNSDNEQ